jgi:hypothetical protein
MLFAAWNDQRTGPDPQRVVESRAVVGLSDLVTLGVVGKKVVRPRANVRVKGSLLGELTAGGERITVLKGSTKTSLSRAATVTTLPTGAFAYATKAPARGKLFFLAAFGPAGLDVTPTACADPHPEATLGCTSATLGGITSKLASVTVKRP